VRVWLATIGVCAVMVAIGTPAEAQNYPWCANYGSPAGDGGTNCGFTTFQQCLATVSGIGGSCDRNTQYVPPGGSRAPRHGRHYRRDTKD
jgi:Protein of unknown function (DUF3551)